MKALYLIPTLAFFVLISCIRIEEEPILLIDPTAEISAHVRNERIYATALISVNPQILTAGNIPTIFEFSGELAIYNSNSGEIIDSNALSGQGLSQVYTVTAGADSTQQQRFVVIASGTIIGYADIGNDDDSSNDKIISAGDFHQEATYLVSDFIIPPSK
jgi:hypothetical protein